MEAMPVGAFVAALLRERRRRGIFVEYASTNHQPRQGRHRPRGACRQGIPAPDNAAPDGAWDHWASESTTIPPLTGLNCIVPPQIIWLTCGNTSEAALIEILSASFLEAKRLLESGENLVEIGNL